ncbi:MAG: DUF4238 domain-containing protein [Telluria sp.]
MPDENYAKNCHWVPQFYLRYFSPAPSAKPPRVYVTNKHEAYETGELKSKTARIRDVAAVLHLYNAAAPNGRIDPALEESFKLVEKQAGEVWQRLSQGKPLNLLPGGDDRLIIAQFLAAQHLRVPRMIAVVENAIRRGNPDVDMDEMDEAGLDRLHKEINAIDLRLGPEPLDMQARDPFRAMITANWTTVTKILYDMCWSIRAFDKPGLVTSDAPLYVINFETMGPWLHGDPASLTYYPMTQRHLLLITGSRIGGPVDGSISPGNASILPQVNAMTLHFASSEIYSPISMTGKFDVLRD